MSSKDSSATKGTPAYNEKIERAENWVKERHSIGYDSSLQELDQIFDESLEVLKFLRDIESTIRELQDDTSKRIVEVEIKGIESVLLKLKENQSKNSLEITFKQLARKIGEFYTLTLKNQKEMTPKEQEIKGKWKSELDKLGL